MKNYLLSSSINKKSNYGFSLVEIMIVVAALGGLSLIVTNLTKQSTKSSAKFQFDTELALITNDINQILSNPDKCLTTFTNATQATSPAPVLLDTTPLNVLAPTGIAGIPSTNRKYTISGGPYGNAGVKISQFSLNLNATPDPLLTIDFDKKNILGDGIISKSIKLYVEKNGSGVITSCRSLLSSSSDIWSRGEDTNIYYNGGVRVGDQTQAVLCDSANEGTQRYNKATHYMEYCGYNVGPPVTYSWKILGGGGLGVGQTWQDVRLSRSLGVVYTNTTAAPIQIAATLQVCSASNSFSVLTIDGVVIGQVGKAGGNADKYQLTGIVPPSGTYSISTGLGAMCLISWSELK